MIGELQCGPGFARGKRVMDGKRAFGRSGSPYVPPGRGDPRRDLDRFLGYEPGRPKLFAAHPVFISALAAVEAVSGPWEEASGTHDL